MISTTPKPTTPKSPIGQRYNSTSNTANTTRQAPDSASPRSRLRQIPSSPSTNHRLAPPVVSGIQYADHGTQWSPPNWTNNSSPSSSSTSSIVHHQYSSPSSSHQQQQHRNSSATAALSKLAVADQTGSDPSEPTEPRVRVTPQSSLHNAEVSSSTTSVRRAHSLVSDSSEPSTATTTTTTTGATPSSHKKARQTQDDTKQKTMPADYSQCDAKELAVLISDMLMELIQFNDEIPLRDGHLTRFHSRAPPGISVRDYLQRLTFHATLPPPILLAMVFYIDRLCAYYPQFTINSLTVHRFLITAATVASKGLSDSFWTNNTYARVGGVSIKELALLELELLSRMEWRIVPQPEMLVDYYKSLVARSSDHRIEDTSPSIETTSDGSGTTVGSLASTSDDAPMTGTG